MSPKHLLVCTALLAACAAPEPEWQTLFDGSSLAAWRGYQMDSMPSGWQIVDGALMRVGRAGDIITRTEYANFDLELDWRIQACGNSGVFFRVTEADSNTYRTGPEMQVLDDACHPDGRSRLTAAGSNFGLYPSPAGIVRPAGEWNHARLRVEGSHVMHWLNDSLVVQYDLGSPEWEDKVANSKFAAWAGYGRAPRGHIALQDHGDTVAFRNIRIRELAP